MLTELPSTSVKVTSGFENAESDLLLAVMKSFCIPPCSSALICSETRGHGAQHSAAQAALLRRG